LDLIAGETRRSAAAPKAAAAGHMQDHTELNQLAPHRIDLA
jgi:hypothetical protein